MDNNSEIVLYQNSEGDINIDVRLEDDTVWLSQKQLAELFQRDVRTVNYHIKSIYEEEELVPDSTIRNFRIVQTEGKREVSRDVDFYNLDMIISVGYRVKSKVATRFRIWATQTLRDYLVKGFVLNDNRFKSGNSMNYFNELQERIREIRLSERFFYQKIKDIYTTSIDYDPNDEKTISFFKIVQNKLLWAISQQTAAELVYRRVDCNLPLLGMQSFDKSNTDSIKKKDEIVAKNYLNEDEIKLLGLLVEQYLAFAETMAQQHTPMYMDDWVQRLDSIIQLNGKELLSHAGKVSHKMALDKSAIEYDKFVENQKKEQYESSLLELEADIKQLSITNKKKES